MLEKDAKQVTRMTHCRGHIYPPPQKTSYAAVSIFLFQWTSWKLYCLKCLLPHHIFTKGWWHVEEDISVGLVGFGCTSLSARADVWTIRSNAFWNLQTLGGLPWWGYGTIGAQCSVRHFARVDNALMGLRCVELQYFAVLQRVDNALMEVATTTEVRPWHLRSLHPVLCLHQQYHHQHHHQHHCQLLPMYVLQIKPGIALNSQTCGESWIATEVKVVLNVHQLYHCTAAPQPHLHSPFLSSFLSVVSYFHLWSFDNVHHRVHCAKKVQQPRLWHWDCPVTVTTVETLGATKAVRQTNLLLLKRNLTADEIVFKSSPVRRSI